MKNGHPKELWMKPLVVLRSVARVVDRGAFETRCMNASFNASFGAAFSSTGLIGAMWPSSL